MKYNVIFSYLIMRQFFSLLVSWHDINLNNHSMSTEIKGSLHAAGMFCRLQVAG